MQPEATTFAAILLLQRFGPQLHFSLLQIRDVVTLVTSKYVLALLIAFFFQAEQHPGVPHIEQILLFAIFQLFVVAVDAF